MKFDKKEAKKAITTLIDSFPDSCKGYTLIYSKIEGETESFELKVLK